MIKTKRKTGTERKKGAAAKHPEWLGARIREQPDPGSICSQQREVDCSLSSAAGALSMSLCLLERPQALPVLTGPEGQSALCVRPSSAVEPSWTLQLPKTSGSSSCGYRAGSRGRARAFWPFKEATSAWVLPWSTTGPRAAVHRAKCRDTTLPKQTAGTCGGPRSVLQYPPTLPCPQLQLVQTEVKPLSLLTPSITSLPDDVQMTDKITISKQFKEKVIRPILKVWMVFSWLMFQLS